MHIEATEDREHRFFGPELPVNRHHLKAAGHLTVLDSLVQTEYDPSASSWDPDFKAFYTFDENGLLTEYREEVWNSESESFEQTDYETNTYDEQGNLAVFIDYDLDDSGTDFYSRLMIEYTWEDGRLAESLESGKDAPGESWYNIWRTEYSYNESGQLTGTREYILLIGWKETWRTEYVYDDEGNLITYYDYDDNEDLPSGWEYAWKEEYTYNDEHHLSLYEEFEWSTDFNQWIPSDREEYTILSNGDVESYTDFDWDEAGEEWVPSWRGEYTYNPEIPYEELALPWFFHDDFPNYFNHMMTRYTNYDYEGGDWVLDSRGDYHFTLSSATGLFDKSPEEGILYPNPATSILYLPATISRDTERMDVYDLTGKMVHTERVKNHHAMKVDHLGKGIYFFSCINAEGQIILSQKIILE